MLLIDTHAHIYLPEFDKDREMLIDRAKNAGIKKILMPAIDHSTHFSMLQTEEQFDCCYSMMGLHPCSVKEDYTEEITIVEAWLTKRKFIALGEIGLDFYWDKTFAEQQYNVFHLQVKLALKYDLPIVIHSRNATDECIEVVKQYPDLKGVFHCFSGTKVQAEKVIELGFLIGIGGVVTFKNSGLDKVIQEFGCGQVILETDAPYLAPVPYRGKRNEPAYLSYIVEKIAELTGKDAEEVTRITTQNAINLFNLS